MPSINVCTRLLVACKDADILVGTCKWNYLYRNQLNRNYILKDHPQVQVGKQSLVKAIPLIR